MSKQYYVIVDLYNLAYQRQGDAVSLKDADKFKTFEEAKKELEKYDDDFNGAIYKVTEYIRIDLEKVEEEL